MSLIDDLRSLDPKQPGNWPWLIKLGAFVLIFIGIQVLVNYMRAVKEAKNSGKAIEIGSLFDMSNIVNNIIAVFIAGIFMMCCFLPFGLVYFVMPILADHPGIGFMDAIKAALAFGKKNFVASLLLMLVLGLVGGLGSIACIIAGTTDDREPSRRGSGAVASSTRSSASPRRSAAPTGTCTS